MAKKKSIQVPTATPTEAASDADGAREVIKRAIHVLDNGIFPGFMAAEVAVTRSWLKAMFDAVPAAEVPNEQQG